MIVDKLTKEEKDKWVAALRSGDFKQGRDQLYNSLTNTYCCLGVLAEINNQLKCGLFKAKDYHIGNPISLFRQEASASYYLDEGDQDSLMEMNDSGTDFKAIADWIENNIEHEE